MEKIFSALVLAALFVAPAAAFASVDITLDGGDVTLYAGQTYVEPGYSANSTVDGDITSSVATTAVDTSHAGKTSRGYSVTDSALDSASASRNITILNVGMGSPCLMEVHHYSSSCAGGLYTPAQAKPVVAQILDGELMPVMTNGIQSFVPSTSAYQAKWNADKAAALANGTIDTWYQSILAIAVSH